MSNCCGEGSIKKKRVSSGKVDPVIVGIIVTTVLLLGGVTAVAMRVGNEVEVVVEEGAKIELSEVSHNWGDIPIDGGNVEKVFVVANKGSADLELANFATSCMCTTVQVITAAGSSQVFGMHTKSEWKGTVFPGETAEVKVVFDPAFHGPQGKGKAVRIVKFQTNDPGKSEVELMLSGLVI